MSSIVLVRSAISWVRQALTFRGENTQSEWWRWWCGWPSSSSPSSSLLPDAAARVQPELTDGWTNGAPRQSALRLLTAFLHLSCPFSASQTPQGVNGSLSNRFKVALTRSTPETWLGESGWMHDRTLLGVFQTSYCGVFGQERYWIWLNVFSRVKLKLCLVVKLLPLQLHRQFFLFNFSAVLSSKSRQSSSVYTETFRFFLTHINDKCNHAM